ncbi:MAG: PspC domain-containing protein [Flavobacteriales bacterium]|nr:PspC domain-containing protein [Flavobacteriales bacterium]
MKKTLTANVSGTVFHIEEDAYDRLQQYLGSIRAQFEGTEGREEILADIEARIAELFHERLDDRRQVVSIEDVDHVIGVMGQPEDYADGDSASSEGPSTSSTGSRGYKRLFRDPDDKWVGGVIGGLAAYIGMDPIWLRIIMIVFIVLGSGTPILLYLILWILVPMADSPADRLRMEGEPVTVDNLKRAFEEGGKRMATEAKDLGKSWEKEAKHRAKDLGKNWGNEAKRRGATASDVVGKLIGAGIIVVAFGLLLGLITSIVGGMFGLWHATWGAEDMGLLDLGALVFASRNEALWLGIGLLLLALIPIIAILLAGFRLLLNTSAPAWLVWTLAVLWFSALVPTVIGGMKLAREFHRSNSVRDEALLATPVGDVLYLDALIPRDSTGWSVRFDRDDFDVNLEGLHIEDNRISGGWARLDVDQSPDSLYRLVTIRSAHGRTAKERWRGQGTSSPNSAKRAKCCWYHRCCNSRLRTRSACRMRASHCSCQWEKPCSSGLAAMT